MDTDNKFRQQCVNIYIAGVELKDVYILSARR